MHVQRYHSQNPYSRAAANRSVDPAIQPKSIQVIQRHAIDSTGYQHSAHGNYGINPLARDVLYGVNHAIEPQPKGLYMRKPVDDAGLNNYAFAWKPNVVFLNKEQKNVVFEDNRMVYTDEKGKELELDLVDLKAQVERPKTEKGVRSPLIGMLGKNDCAQFATALYNAIARAGYQQQQQPGALTEQILKSVEEYPDMQVGDMMQHIFDDGGRCPWHAATVVAKDAKSLITLEANVVEEIDAPSFYIRKGVKGFVKDNDPQADESGKGIPRGRKVNITKYNSGMPPAKDLELYDALDNSFAGTYRLRGGVYTTPVLIHRLLTRVLTSSAAIAFWKRQTLNPFSDDMPEGITAMQQTVVQNFEGTVVNGGSRWLANRPFARSIETNIFYRILYEFNPEQPDHTLSKLNRFAKLYNI